jgi:hypothetical protein
MDANLAIDNRPLCCRRQSTMSKRNVFRPALDPLEDRLALSGAGMSDPDSIQFGDQVQSGDQNPALDVPGAPESDVAQAGTGNGITAAQNKSHGALIHRPFVQVIHHPVVHVIPHGKHH